MCYTVARPVVGHVYNTCCICDFCADRHNPHGTISRSYSFPLHRDPSQITVTYIPAAPLPADQPDPEGTPHL